MREFMRNMRNLWRRARLKFEDGRTVAVAGRWLALCLLIAGVAAVGVWGSTGEPGGLNAALQEVWQPNDGGVSDVVNVAKVPGEPPVTSVATSVAVDLGKKNTTDVVANSDLGVDSSDVNAVVGDVPPDDVPSDDEVVDGAPEPWVGDAALEAEAKLLSPVPPLAEWTGEPLRGFGYGLDATFGDYRYHGGADWQAAEGVSVLAALDGVVAEITEDEVWGEGVRLNCGEKLELAYYGLKCDDLQVGQQMKAGDKLGEVAPSPLFEDGYPAHLHLEIWLDGVAVDPTEYLGR